MNTKVVKTLAAALTAIVVLVSNPTISKAGDGGVAKKTNAVKEEQVAVKYLGTSENNIIFKVEFENPTAEKFSLIIKNDNGDVVYNQASTDSHFSKSVYIQNTDSEFHPTFIIRNDKSEVVRHFSVVKTFSENTVVASL
jgi:hypothetical protein